MTSSLARYVYDLRSKPNARALAARLAEAHGGQIGSSPLIGDWHDASQRLVLRVHRAAFGLELAESNG